MKRIAIVKDRREKSPSPRSPSTVLQTAQKTKDDMKIAAALAIRLTAAGYEVLTAPDGFEGLKLAVSFQPDLIISDIWMPVGLGLSIAQRLQELAPGLPVIFITSGREQGLEETAKQLGAVAFF